MPLDFPQERAAGLEKRFVISLMTILVFFFFVVSRLFYLQVVRGDFYWVFSAEHTMKEIRRPSTRGLIYDRNRIPIAENRPSFDLTLVPQHVRDIERVAASLRQVAGIDPVQVETKWKEKRRMPAFFPLVVAADIPYDQAARIRVAKSIEPHGEDTLNLEGVEVMVRPLRSYPQGPIAAATVGYLGEISEKDLTRFQKEEPGRYSLGDLVGAAGLERYWERLLKGRDGYEQKIVDAVGREIVSDELASFLRREEALPGNNLILTLDSRLQKFAEERFGDKAGSLVAIDPQTGEILAFVSRPTYDPLKLVANISHENWTSLTSDPRKLFLNRGLQGTYPPGSTYKVITAIAGLEEGVLKPEETFFCGGGLKFGNRFFKCWNKGGHGSVSVHRAISESCDTFFYQVGLRLGPDRLAKYANLLGLGQKTGIDLEGEKGGTIPTSEWKRKMFQQEWHPGESLSIAVGQGYNTVTPLQNALMAAEVALGKKVVPHLLKAFEDEGGGEILGEQSNLAEDLPISKETLAIVRSAMADTVASPSGTAHGIVSKIVKIAGKTGTAQVIGEEAKGRLRTRIETGDHAWFISFAPAESSESEPPKIAVSVLVEHGGFGATAAAPIARDVIEKYMELQRVR